MPNNHVLLETVTLSQNAASVVFDNIPQSGYTDLKIIASAKSTRAADEDGLGIKLNSSTTGYTYRILTGDGSGGNLGSLTTPYEQTWSGRIPGANAGSDVFSATDIYIPNYLGNAAKSYIVDSVTEKNAATAYMTIGANLQTSTAAISSIEFSALNGSLAARSTFSLYGVSALGVTPTGLPKASGGNIVTTDGTYWYHAFLSSGTFTLSASITADVLVVAGGGAGASVGGSAETGGGGGAGGLRALLSQTFSATSHAVTVGAGGSGGSSGTNSSVNSITASGGGAGGGGAGGSGGGGLSANSSQRFGGTGNAGGYTPVEGYAGGNGNSASNSFAGGGGGAGAVGANGTAGQSGAGGIGLFTAISGGSTTGLGVLSGGNYYFAGGGGGGSASGVSSGAGGTGGGGNGSVAGIANTGGGGGGRESSGGSSPAGGSGIVIIRYAI